jgi:ribosome-associated heat shock protein Hsp15
MNNLPAPMEVRIDKWLWAVRVFKTRSLATEACRGGHVKIEGENVKPARAVRINEVIVVKNAEVTRTIKVTGLLDKRVGPKKVGEFMEDQTPAAEYLRHLEQRKLNASGVRPKGAGRPTKKERRQMDEIL